MLPGNSLAPKSAPLQPLHSALFERAGVELWVKREDLIDRELGGNKWHKLKHNLHAAHQQGFGTLLTFGGAWSNHIYATAAAGRRFGFNTIGIIRGDAHTELNPTLRFARDCGMHLHFMDRATYREKNSVAVLLQLKDRFGDFYLVPEGGSNALAVQGCREMTEAIEQAFDYICCACGTGATLAGISLALNAQQHSIGFAALKGGDFLRDEVTRMRADFLNQHNGQWHLETDYHFGGYAKTTAELFAFMRSFKKEFDIELDAVYTAKMFYGLFDMIKQDYFKPGSRIIAMHSGGLQGNAGFPSLFDDQ